ncbi:MAG: acyl-phosphate glycerol 3-phosphate acyltransferase [Nitrospirae bacterium GWC2_42_7]|nr:MAG: acyl-phosphate glycerol 3-phosphate acyltransferase [Nitrospirae bacterium GWC2_42_7]
MKIILLTALAFMIGSIPTGLLIAKSRGIDIKKSGSGNIGATNVLRTTGRLPALLTLLGDILKGALAVLIARYFEVGMFYEGLIGICSILGHNFSLFLKFKGGKGVATSIGVLCIYSPKTALITIIIWLMIVLITRYSSLGALISFGALPVSIILLDTKDKLPIAFLITLILFIRHIDNVSRMLKGTESKIGGKT